jgi:hypothetical protein
MPTLSRRVMLGVALALVIGIGIILVTQSTVQNGNPLAVLGAKKTIFLHQKPEANVMWNSTGHSYFNMQGKVFRCNSFFDGVIYYKANDTNYFKCIDRGSTRGEDIQYQIVP